MTHTFLWKSDHFCEGNLQKKWKEKENIVNTRQKEERKSEQVSRKMQKTKAIPSEKGR